ncbi:hypothetical protein BKA59DRAFT_470773 [Fusarium tricinctum]|uniref:Uncharacterized protein n=1 Tax=Fusarium tricinctum TaxID=61284 RepID=A0A8K0WFJ1_9HYPO|nr:hypothetical protein BKA59DRAFT_470773 [Fusarium tricinctum]
MPGSIKSIKRRPTAKSAAKRIGRMFKRTNSDDPEAITSTEPKDSFEGTRPSISSRYSTSSRMTVREDAESPSPSTKDQFRPFASLFDPRRQKGSEMVSRPPLVSANSANSEPVPGTLEPAEVTKFIEVAKPIEPEAPTSSTYNGSEIAEKQPESPQQPEKMEKKPEKKIEQAIEKQLGPESPPRPAARPLPYPPAVQATTKRPESPILPAKDFMEKPMLNLSLTPEPEPESKAEAELELAKKSIIPSPTVEGVAGELRPNAFHSKSPVPPRPTVEDEPETIAEPVKEASVEAGSKVAHDGRQRRQPKNIPIKPQQNGTKPNVEPKFQSRDESTTAPQKNTLVQSAPIAPKTTRKSEEVKPLPRVTATTSTLTAPKKPFVPATFSPKTVPVPGTSALSISFQPTRTVFVPDTAPAPHTARPPITAQTPMIATAPKVARSMFAWTVPESASAPIIAAAPQRAY